MRHTTTRLFVAASIAALSIAGCSGKAPESSETEAASTVETPVPAESAAPAAEESATPVVEPSASAIPAPAASAMPAAKPAPKPTPSPAPTPTPTPAPSATAEKVADADAVTPPKAFKRCAVCHNATKGAEAKIGPNLWGVYGTKAGEVPGYHFSDALKASGLTWNDATLDEWIAGPMKMVPGTAMGFPGIKDPEKRAEIIDFLKSAR